MGMTPGDVLASIDGWAGAHVTRLDGGLSNHTWRVDRDGRSAVLKIDDRPRSEPYNSRRREAEIQARACEAGLANRVLYCDDTVYMTEYVEGTVWSLECLEDGTSLERLAIALRKLHSLPLTGRVFDAQGAARNYARHAGNASERDVRACLQRIAAAPRPANLCCCHNDLVVENIINTPDTRFLDWEYACDNDPFFDLATIIEHHRLDDELALQLLDAYFDGTGERWLPQLEAQRSLYAVLYWLWLAARPDSSGDELEAAIERLHR
jgi:thiamine kinase-like enzyme